MIIIPFFLLSTISENSSGFYRSASRIALWNNRTVTRCANYMSYWITELSQTYYRVRLTQQVSLDNHNGWKFIFWGKTSLFIDQMINSLQSKSIAYPITSHGTTNATTQYKSILRNWCILLWILHIAHCTFTAISISFWGYFCTLLWR